MASQYGDITCDGVLTDWTAADLLWSNGTQRIYGKTVGGALIFGATGITSGSTFWLNTDANATTGYLLGGPAGALFAAGAEYNIDFTTGQPRLFTGGAGQTLVGPVDFAQGAGGVFGVLRHQGYHGHGLCPAQKGWAGDISQNLAVYPQGFGPKRATIAANYAVIGQAGGFGNLAHGVTAQHKAFHQQGRCAFG